MFARLAANTIERMRNNRLLSTVYHELRLRRAGSVRAPPILVFQMGKVASSAIFDALRAAELRSPIFHIHFLNPASIRGAEDLLRRTFGTRGSVNRWALYESRYVRRHFLKDSHRPIKIVSLVRDPVSRNLSSFFANLDMFIPHCLARFDQGSLTVADIRRHFLTDFHEHTYPLQWFDEEMKSTFGIDVFADDDVVRRSDTLFQYKRDHVELLVLRVEDLADGGSRALEDFLGIAPVTLRATNEARSKDYDRVYRAVIKRLKLPEDYLARMYSSRLSTRFYDSAMIDRFRSRWTEHLA